MSLLLLPLAVFSQNIEKHPFSNGNPANYYLAVKPKGPIKAVLVLLNANFAPETIPPETRLHNVAYNNSILTIYSTIPGLVADTASLGRITRLFQSVAPFSQRPFLPSALLSISPNYTIGAAAK